MVARRAASAAAVGVAEIECGIDAVGVERGVGETAIVVRGRQCGMLSAIPTKPERR